MKFSLKEIQRIRVKYEDQGSKFFQFTEEMNFLGVEVFDISIDNGIEQYYGPDGLVFVTPASPIKVAINTKTPVMIGVEDIVREYLKGLLSLVAYREKIATLGVEFIRVDLRQRKVQYCDVFGDILYEHKLPNIKTLEKETF